MVNRNNYIFCMYSTWPYIVTCNEADINRYSPIISNTMTLGKLVINLIINFPNVMVLVCNTMIDEEI